MDYIKVLSNSPGDTEETHINLRHNSSLTWSRLDSVPPECDVGENINQSGSNRRKEKIT